MSSSARREGLRPLSGWCSIGTFRTHVKKGHMKKRNNFSRNTSKRLVTTCRSSKSSSKSPSPPTKKFRALKGSLFHKSPIGNRSISRSPSSKSPFSKRNSMSPTSRYPNAVTKAKKRLNMSSCSSDESQKTPKSLSEGMPISGKAMLVDDKNGSDFDEQKLKKLYLSVHTCQFKTCQRIFPTPQAVLDHYRMTHMLWMKNEQCRRLREEASSQNMNKASNEVVVMPSCEKNVPPSNSLSDLQSSSSQQSVIEEVPGPSGISKQEVLHNASKEESKTATPKKNPKELKSSPKSSKSPDKSLPSKKKKDLNFLKESVIKKEKKKKVIQKTSPKTLKKTTSVTKKMVEKASRMIKAKNSPEGPVFFFSNEDKERYAPLLAKSFRVFEPKLVSSSQIREGSGQATVVENVFLSRSTSTSTLTENIPQTMNAEYSDGTDSISTSPTKENISQGTEKTSPRKTTPTPRKGILKTHGENKEKTPTKRVSFGDPIEELPSTDDDDVEQLEETRSCNLKEKSRTPPKFVKRDESPSPEMSSKGRTSRLKLEPKTPPIGDKPSPRRSPRIASRASVFSDDILFRVVRSPITKDKTDKRTSTIEVISLSSDSDSDERQ